MREAVDEASGAVSATVAAAMRIAGITQQMLATGGRENRELLEHRLRVAAQLNRITNEAEKHKLEMYATRRRIERGDEYLDNDRRQKSYDNFRSQELHNSRMRGQALTSEKTRLEASIAIADAIKRDARAARKNDAEVDLTRARTDIARADHERRGQESDKEQTRKDEEHGRRMENLGNQDERAGKKHDLEIKEIRERMEHRRRAAGFTDDLAQGQRDQDRVRHASAAYAAAASTADRGPRAERDAQAYAQRAREDGLTPETTTTATRTVELSEEDLARLIEETVAATVDSFATHSVDPDTGPSAPPPADGRDIGAAVNVATSPATDTGTARTGTTSGHEQQMRAPGAQTGPDVGP